MAGSISVQEMNCSRRDCSSRLCTGGGVQTGRAAQKEVMGHINVFKILASMGFQVDPQNHGSGTVQNLQGIQSTEAKNARAGGGLASGDGGGEHFSGSGGGGMECGAGGGEHSSGGGAAMEVICQWQGHQET